MNEDRRSRAPAGAAGLLVGALAADLVLRFMAGHAPPGPAPSSLPLLASPRTLRRAEGVGAVRATVIARALWRLGPEIDLEQIPGVGPRTAEAARRSIAPMGSQGVHSLALHAHDGPRPADRHR